MKASAALAPALCEAASIVAAVAAGKSLTEQFERPAEVALQSPRGALTDLTHGALRRYGRVQAIVEALSRRGRPDHRVEALLWCSLYAIESRRYADYTVVDQAVRACGLLECWTAKGYVNAVLRAYLRERESIETRVQRDPEARYQHPRWWIEIVQAAHPTGYEAVLAAGNAHPPMGLRVNGRRAAVDDYLQRLAAEGMQARRVGAGALLLEQPVGVERLPGFAAGEVSVQDAGAQRAAHCLDLQSGQRVLDACAAPGGKTAHILETAEVDLTALDIDAARCTRIERTLDRLGLRAQVRVADCTEPATWWSGAPFDRILADVPCSASGVARRHPDVKWLRRAQDIGKFAARQSAMLRALWQVLAPGGKLLYATCSVFPAENSEVVEAFVGGTPGARLLALPDGDGAQWLPDAEHDGFYYALIEKQA